MKNKKAMYRIRNPFMRPAGDDKKELVLLPSGRIAEVQ